MVTKKNKKAGEAKNGNTVVVYAIVAVIAGTLGVLVYNSPLVQRPNAYDPKPVKASPQELTEGNVKEINNENPGETISLTGHLVSGHYTLFDFYSHYCGPCMAMSERLVELTRLRPDFAVRSVNVDRDGAQSIDWESPVCTQYDIHSLPYFMLYGSDGKLIAKGREARAQIEEIMSKEIYNSQQ